MKPIRNESIRALRKLLGQTQTEFATTVGVSKDAVVSWENGRNPLSETFARRIALITGVSVPSLLKGKGDLKTERPPTMSYTREEFERHRKTFWGQSPEASVRRQIGAAADTLELLFLAAAKTGGAEGPARLPGVLDAFNQWCKQAAEDFELLPAIDAELAQRKSTLELTKTHAQWRAMAKEDPKMARRFGFKDDPKKKDEEALMLAMETCPVWAPGWDMRRKAKS
jgi:transcriptional regulator with XRE-family HTH domain